MVLVRDNRLDSDDVAVQSIEWPTTVAEAWLSVLSRKPI